MASGSQTRGSSKQTSATPSAEGLPRLVKEMSASFARLTDAVRTSTEEIQEALEEQQETIGEVPGQLAEGMAAVRDAIADLTETQSLVEERLADVASSVVTSTEVEKAVDAALTGAASAAAEEQLRGAERASARIEEALTSLARRLGQSVSEVREEARPRLATKCCP
jgi:ABC-type transporter Mla subunit MlaD